MGGDLQQKLGVGFSQHDYRLVGVEFLDGFHQLFALCETVIRACSLDGEWVRRRHREGHFVGPEEEGHGTGYGAGDVVNPGSVENQDKNVPFTCQGCKRGTAEEVATSDGQGSIQ